MRRINYLLLIIIMLINAVPVFAQNQSRNQFEVMVYLSPDKWHNVTEPTAILEFQKLANRHAFGLTVTEVVNNFNDENLRI